MPDRPHNIYKITCAVTGKSYIGLTCRKVQARWVAHTSWAKTSGRRSALVSAIIEHGESAFRFEVLATAVNYQEGVAIERALIAQYGTMIPGGYNMRPGGEGPHEYSQTAKVRMSIAAKKRPRFSHTDETRKKMSESRKRIMNDDMRAAIGRAHKGKKQSPEALAKFKATIAAKRSARLAAAQSMG